MPLVSIITALHNKGAYVTETIRSVLAQSMADWELVVVENGSTDKGPEVVRQFSDSRIRLVFSAKHGPGAARNFGLNLATGEWILFLDADDLIGANYLEARLASLQGQAPADIIAGPWQEFRDGCQTEMVLRFPASWRRPRHLLDTNAFAFAPWALHAALLRRRHVVPDHRWDEDLDCLHAEDCAFWFRVIYSAKVVWSDHNSAFYRKHTMNSREEAANPIQAAVRGCARTVCANERFLAQLGQRPSSEQAATVVRVLRRLYSRADHEQSSARNEVRNEIKHWLRATSYKNVRMLFWRLYFLELKGWKRVSQKDTIIT